MQQGHRQRVGFASIAHGFRGNAPTASAVGVEARNWLVPHPSSLSVRGRIHLEGSESPKRVVPGPGVQRRGMEDLPDVSSSSSKCAPLTDDRVWLHQSAAELGEIVARSDGFTIRQLKGGSAPKAELQGLRVFLALTSNPTRAASSQSCRRVRCVAVGSWQRCATSFASNQNFCCCDGG